MPEERILAEIDKYPNLEEIMWAQEEPLNQGAWYYLAPELFRMVVPAPTKAKLLHLRRVLPLLHLRQAFTKTAHRTTKALIAEALGVTVEALK